MPIGLVDPIRAGLKASAMPARPKKTGDKIYEEWRSMDDGKPEKVGLLMQMRKVYASAMEKADPEWRSIVSGLQDQVVGGMPASGNSASKSSAESDRPLSMISDELALTQPSDGSMMAQPVDPLRTTAGLPSQSKNIVRIRQDIGTLPTNVDPIRPPKEPVSPEVQEAAEAVGKSENTSEYAERAGIDPFMVTSSGLAGLTRARCQTALKIDPISASNICTPKHNLAADSFR